MRTNAKRAHADGISFPATRASASVEFSSAVELPLHVLARGDNRLFREALVPRHDKSRVVDRDYVM